MAGFATWATRGLTESARGAVWATPTCRHGRILLGCPHDDCPEQLAYLAELDAARHAYEVRAQMVIDPGYWATGVLEAVAPAWAVEHDHASGPRWMIEFQPVEGETQPRLTFTCGDLDCGASLVIEPADVAAHGVATGAA